jgi:hypothetical protein
MIRKIIRYIQAPVIFLLLFAFYWFLNSGFLTDPLWLPIQASLFTVITLFIFRYQKIKLVFWFLAIGLLYISTAVFEILQLRQASIMAASTGFGVLVIVILFQVFKSVSKRR